MRKTTRILTGVYRVPSAVVVWNWCASCGWIRTLLIMLIFATNFGCRQKMADQPILKPLQKPSLPIDRRPPAATVSRGVNPHHIATQSLHFLTGKVNGEPATSLPPELKEPEKSKDDMLQTLQRGRERYNAYCSHCHGFLGSGKGMVVRRGFPPAATLHSERLREAPLGHFFDVISNGKGNMPALAAQVSTADRWRIAAYVRALQLSQNVTADQLSERELEQLQQVNKSADPTDASMQDVMP